MREILFRGKNIDKDEWVKGYYCPTLFSLFSRFPKPTIYPASGIISHWDGIEVNPETIGQYTGLADKNGKKIFEGDIVKCRDITNDYEFLANVQFGNPNGEYNWGYQLVTAARVNKDILCWVNMDDAGTTIEVIGNIYDNPELLEAVE